MNTQYREYVAAQRTAAKAAGQKVVGYKTFDQWCATHDVAPNTDSFITTTHGMSGYFAVQMWWNGDAMATCGFWEPYQTGIGRYATKAEAENEARSWALSDDLQFKP